MQKEFEIIIYKLHELLAVEQLEYHNKTWLSGSDATRSEQKQDDLKHLINRLNTLALNVADKLTLDANQLTSTCKGNCGMNYYGENGCIERKRVLKYPCPPDDIITPANNGQDRAFYVDVDTVLSGAKHQGE